MKIEGIDVLTADAGWRIHDFVKIATSDGLVGWSEFSRAFAGPGVCEAIAEISSELVGMDPRSSDTSNTLAEYGRRSIGAYQASSALQNALLDVSARALGVAVHELLGARVRERIRVYWAHCGTYRVNHADLMGKAPLTTLSDVVDLGREVVACGYTALKTNLLVFDNGCAYRYRYVPTAGPAAPHLMKALGQQLAAFREGVGPDVDLMVDLGSNFCVDGVLDMARAMEPYAPAWLELELRDRHALQSVRSHTSVPIASGERLRTPEYDELLRAGGIDVPIVDVLFNGVADSLNVARACAARDMQVAVHNCYSPLATMMAAAFCAVAPNLYILEHDVDGVPWQSEFVTRAPDIRDGYLVLPTGPGWGTEVDEAAVRAHPAGRVQ